jgi:Asp-tRNA(Asn)/Glu-tRNA(Gln) amidotransferase A subunit family amidase
VEARARETQAFTHSLIHRVPDNMMMTEDYLGFDATGLAALVSRREVSPQELLDAAIARTEAVNPKVNAIAARHYDEARAAIRAGLPEGAFRGVPFLLKDLNALLAGTVTSNGCRFFQDNRADHDTELVSRYKRGGMVIFGKTNTPEFGLTVSTEPRLFGPTRNPWLPTHMAGGSSGGAAAAVAAGIVPAAHASDGGGSIRIPASCCGLFGLKPTRARNPHGPDRGEGWSGASTEHVVSRSVRDSAAILDLTCGPDVGAPYFATPPAVPFLAAMGASGPVLRIGMVTRTAAGEGIDPECERAVRATARLLEGLGHRVDEISLSSVEQGFGPAFRVIIAGNIRTAIELHAARTGRQPAPDDLEKVTWAMFEAGGRASAADYARAVVAIHRVGRQFAALFQVHDLVLAPTLPKPPQPLGVFSMMAEDLDAYGRDVGFFTSFTAIVNLAGNPAASLPLHWTPDGLPVGVQLIGRYGDEASVLRVSAQLEQERPWFHRRPALL